MRKRDGRIVHGSGGHLIVIRTYFIYRQSGEMIMRCIFTHEWITSWARAFSRSFVPYRKCARCGIMQRGICDSLTREVSWETVRERTYVWAQQNRIVRRPSSGLDKLAHSLGLRRTRMSDRAVTTEAPH